MDDRRFLIARTAAWMSGLSGARLPKSAPMSPAELEIINTIYDESRNKGDTRRISIEDAMRMAQHRVNRGRDGSTS